MFCSEDFIVIKSNLESKWDFNTSNLVIIKLKTSVPTAMRLTVSLDLK